MSGEMREEKRMRQKHHNRKIVINSVEKKYWQHAIHSSLTVSVWGKRIVWLILDENRFEIKFILYILYSSFTKKSGKHENDCDCQLGDSEYIYLYKLLHTFGSMCWKRWNEN